MLSFAKMRCPVDQSEPGQEKTRAEEERGREKSDRARELEEEEKGGEEADRQTEREKVIETSSYNRLLGSVMKQLSDTFNFLSPSLSVLIICICPSPTFSLSFFPPLTSFSHTPPQPLPSLVSPLCVNLSIPLWEKPPDVRLLGSSLAARPGSLGHDDWIIAVVRSQAAIDLI